MIGLSSACFYPEETEKTVPVIAGLGYTKAEFFLNCHAEFSPGYLSELRRLCDDCGITPVSVHPYTSFAEPNLFFSNYQRRFDDGLELYKQYFHAAAVFGAKLFVLHGARLRQEKLMPPMLYAERFSLLSRAARTEGIELCQENVIDYLCGKADYLKECKDLLGDEISFTLDLKQANRAGEDPLSLAAIMGDRLKHCHINDFDGEHGCMLPTFGSFDFHAFFKLLKKIGYQGDLITEVYSHNYSDVDQFRQSKARLESILSEIEDFSETENPFGD